MNQHDSEGERGGGLNTSDSDHKGSLIGQNCQTSQFSW